MGKRGTNPWLRSILLAVTAAFGLGGCGGGDPAQPPPTNFKIQIASVDDTGTPATLGGAAHYNALSVTGRYVLFAFDAASDHPKAVVRDTCIGASNCTRTNTLASVFPDGSAAIDGFAAISPDGRYVAFDAFAPGNLKSQVYLRDTCVGVTGCRPSTQLISVATDGTLGNDSSSNPVVSKGGRYVVFFTEATNLAGPANSNLQLMLRDTCLGASGCHSSTSIVSVAPDGTAGNGGSGLIFEPMRMTPDGRYVAFTSTSTNLVSGQSGGLFNIFVRDTCAGASFCTPSTVMASVFNDGDPARQSNRPTISSNGRFVVFNSAAMNSGAMYLRDTCIGAASCVPSTTLIVSATLDVPGWDNPAISGDGRFVVYPASDQAPGLLPFQVFVRDTCLEVRGCTPSTKLASVSADGMPNNGFLINTIFDFFPVSISGDGRAVAFTSWATNLVPGMQDNVAPHVYVAPNPFN